MPTKRETFAQTVRARYLGQRMRELREERGITLKYIADYLGVEFSTLARYERAEWPFRKDHVIALLDVYGVHEESNRAALVELAANAWRINRWDHAATVLLDRDAPAADERWLASQAEEIHTYGTVLIPDLLRTRDYSFAVSHHAHGLIDDGHTVEREVRVHLERQQILHSQPPTILHGIIEEVALRRPVGGLHVLQAQLEHLAQTARGIPYIQIRVLPTATGLHPGTHGAFTVYRMARPYPDVAYVEHLGGHLVIEAGGGAERYAHARDQLRELALDENQSAELISKIAAELAYPAPRTQSL